MDFYSVLYFCNAPMQDVRDGSTSWPVDADLGGIFVDLNCLARGIQCVDHCSFKCEAALCVCQDGEYSRDAADKLSLRRVCGKLVEDAEDRLARSFHGLSARRPSHLGLLGSSLHRCGFHRLRLRLQVHQFDRLLHVGNPRWIARALVSPVFGQPASWLCGVMGFFGSVG